jgi:tetratricopeptide (TPR) repeat protein
MDDPDSNREAYVNGNALYKAGRFNEASKLFLAAIEDDSTDYQALWALGNCYTELKKPRKAEDAFRRAVTLCSNNHRVALVFNLANALFDQEHYAEAIALYAEIPSDHPLSVKAKRNAQLAKERLLAE